MEPLSVPLYQGFFPQLVLGVDELLAYRRLAKERVAQLARVVEDADCVYTWTDVKRASSAAGAKCQRATFVDVRPDSKATRASTLLKASVQLVDAQPEEVLAALARSRTKDLRRTLAYLHGDAFLDAQTLLTFPTASGAKKPAYSYRAIKWCALKSKRRHATTTSSHSHSSGSSDGLADAAAAKGWQGLDFCFLEYAGLKKPRAGSSVLGFIVQEAVSPDREVPHLDAYGLTRAPLSRAGVIISRTHQSNIINVTSVCEIDGALSAPLRLAMEDVLLESVAAIHRVKGLLERQRMGRLQYLEPWEWVANADRKACAVCLRSFLFHRKHHCQTCGEVVCSSCAPLRELEEPLFDAAHIRVCSLCLAGAAAAAGTASAAASTERTSSNGGTDAYLRDLQQNPRDGGGRTRQRPTRLLEEEIDDDSDDPDDRDDRERRPQPSTLRTSDLSFGGRQHAGPGPSLSAAAKTDALSKLAYHMQQIRETINVAVSDADHHSASLSGDDDMYDTIRRIRDTLDISSPEFDAVLAALGSSVGGRSDSGGGGSEDYYRYSSSSGGDRSSTSHDNNRHFLFFSSSDDQLSASSRSSRSSRSQSSSRGTGSHASRTRSARSGRATTTAAAAAAVAMQEETARYYARHPDNTSSHSSRGGRSRRSPAHKDSLFSDQTAASSSSKQSSDGKPPRQQQLRSEHVVQLDNTRGIHRLAQKIEKLQQRLDDSRRAASVVSSSDLSIDSEPEPELIARRQQHLHQHNHDHQRRQSQHNRTRRSSYIETKRSAADAVVMATEASSPARKASSSASSSASAAHSTSQMVQALRGVMESSELTPAPPAWRKSFSSAHANSNDASSSASSSSRLSAASLAAHTRRSSASPQKPAGAAAGKVVLGLPPRSGRQSTNAGATAMFVYDEDSVHKFQRLSLERLAPAHPEAAGESASDEDSDDDDDDYDAYEDEQFVAHDGDADYSISSSEDEFALPHLPSFSTTGSRSRGRRRSLLSSGDIDDDAKLRSYLPSSPSVGDSLSEYDDNVASLPSSTPPSSDVLLYEWLGKPTAAQLQSQPQYADDSGESDSSDATRRLIEDVSRLPARMRTSSGQSSGAPSQENHFHHDF